MFRTYGATDVRILNGTLQKWIREDRPVETGPFKDIDDTSESGYDYEFSKTTYDSLQTILNKAYDLYRQKGQHNHLQIIDVRDPLSYRAGTIVGAMNDPYASYLNPEKTRFLSKEELQKMFKTNGIDISKSLSFSWGAGVSAAISEVAAKIAGAPQTSVFDGSFQEYSTKGKPDFSDPEWESKYKF